MKKFLVVLFLMFTQGILALAGDIAGNGGDECEGRYLTVRDDISLWISGAGPNSLKLPVIYSVESYRALMAEKIDKAIISCTDDILSVGVAEKTCVNSYDGVNNIITCNRNRFLSTSQDGQYRLVHHEYAGLAGIESNDGEEESNYYISNQISQFLFEETILRLGIIPNVLYNNGPRLWSLATGKFQYLNYSSLDKFGYSSVQQDVLHFDAIHKEAVFIFQRDSGSGLAVAREIPESGLGLIRLSPAIRLYNRQMTEDQRFLVFGKGNTKQVIELGSFSDYDTTEVEMPGKVKLLYYKKQNIAVSVIRNHDCFGVKSYNLDTKIFWNSAEVCNIPKGFGDNDDFIISSFIDNDELHLVIVGVSFSRTIITTVNLVTSSIVAGPIVSDDRYKIISMHSFEVGDGKEYLALVRHEYIDIFDPRNFKVVKTINGHTHIKNLQRLNLNNPYLMLAWQPQDGPFSTRTYVIDIINNKTEQRQPIRHLVYDYISGESLALSTDCPNDWFSVFKPEDNKVIFESERMSCRLRLHNFANKIFVSEDLGFGTNQSVMKFYRVR